MARPRLTADKKLSKRFVFRLSEDEMKLLSGIATASGKTLGVAVRDKLFTGKYPKAKAARIDIQTYAELKRSA